MTQEMTAAQIPAGPVRVLLVDDDALVRAGLVAGVGASGARGAVDVGFDAASSHEARRSHGRSSP